MSTQPLGVHHAIAEVTEELSKIGVSKDRKNTQQGYNFRGIDDVYNALAPLLAKAKLTITPYTLSREVVERETQRGGVLFYTTVLMDFTFTSAKDGSHITTRVYGEAMDSGDKATNKAMSAAYKYACMQTFCIPTEGDNDADQTTHEVKSTSAIEAEKQAKIEAAKVSKELSASAKEAFKSVIDMAQTLEILQSWGVDNKDEIERLQPADIAEVRKAFKKKHDELKNQQKEAA